MCTPPPPPIPPSTTPAAAEIVPLSRCPPRARGAAAFTKYNAVLRGMSDPDLKGFIRGQFDTICRGNTYEAARQY